MTTETQETIPAGLVHTVATALHSQMCHWPNCSLEYSTENRVAAEAALDAVPEGWAKLDGNWVRLERSDGFETFTAGDGEPAIRAKADLWTWGQTDVTKGADEGGR